MQISACMYECLAPNIRYMHFVSFRHVFLHLTRIAMIHIRWQCIDGLVLERRNSVANVLYFRLFCTNPSIFPAQ